MSSDLNFNVNSNYSSGADQTSGTSDTKATTPVKNGPTIQQPIQDTLSSLSDPNLHKALANYVSNMSHPTLIKPEPKSKFTDGQEGAATARDVKAEHQAGSLASSGQVTTTQDQTNINQTVVQGQQKQRDEDQQGGQGQGKGDQQGQGQKETAPLNEIVKSLNSMIASGETLPDLTGEQISSYLNMGASAAAAPKEAETAPPETQGPEPNVINFTVKGNVISGPYGEMTIPKGTSSVASSMDIAFNAYDMVNKMSSVTQSLAAGLPNSPDQITLARFLQIVSEALEKFQQALYSVNSMTSKQIRSKTQAQLETALKKIDDQFEKMKEMEEKQKAADKKQHSLGALGMVFNIISLIMTVVLLVIFAGPMMLITGPLLALSITSMIQQMSGHETVMHKMFEAMDNLMESLMDSVGITGDAQKWLKIITKVLLVVAVCLVMIAANPLLFIMGGVSNVIDFITESNVVSEFVGDCGGDKKAQMIVTIVTTSLIMMATMAASIALMFVPGTQGALIGEVSNAVAGVVRNLVNALVTVLTQVLKIGEKVAKVIVNTLKMMLKLLINPGFWLQITGLGLQTASTVMSVQMHMLQADLARMRGALEKEVEETDAIIHLMKKMIEKLLENLGDVAQYISKVSGMIQKNINDMENSVANLWSASSNSAA